MEILLKAAATQAFVTALVLLGSCAVAMQQAVRSTPFHVAFRTGLAVFIIFAGLLASQGWTALQYHLYGAEGIVVPPLGVRIFTISCVNLGGSIFIAETTPSRYSFWFMMAAWWTLCGLLVLWVVTTAIL